MGTMKCKMSLRMLIATVCLLFVSLFVNAGNWLAPTDIAKVDEEHFAIIYRNVGQLRIYRASDNSLVHQMDLRATPTGITVNSSKLIAYITTDTPNQLLIVDLNQHNILVRKEFNSAIYAPTLDSTSNTIFVCNRWENKVTALDATTLEIRWCTPVIREPSVIVLDTARNALYVPNAQILETVDHYYIPSVTRLHANTHAMSADLRSIAPKISILNASNGSIIKHLPTQSGFSDYHSIAISPDGSTLATVQNYGKPYQFTFQVDWAWMNSCYLTLIREDTQELIISFPLDDAIEGAANPWCVQWTPDGNRLLVTHSGTHDLSVIDYVKLREKIDENHYKQKFFEDGFEWIRPFRKRIPLEEKGPRNFIQMAGKVLIPGFFSDTLSVVDLASGQVQLVTLNEDFALDLEGRGELYFSDASLCFQHWQSCVSCHPDGRADSFNWDLLNDGRDNPKNTKSLLFSHVTPPSMISGIRKTAEVAVRAGVRHIQFMDPEEDKALAMDAFLKSMRPRPSPRLVNGELSQKALKGKALFEDPKVGCSFCHKGEYFTDLKMHDVGTSKPVDRDQIQFDTPTLREIWRTAPYLHDGSALTIFDLLTTGNEKQRHGKTEGLSQEELESLSEYILSL